MSAEGWAMYRLWLSTLAVCKAGGGRKNPRFKCACGHKTTKRQLKLNGGHCHQCKAPIRRQS